MQLLDVRPITLGLELDRAQGDAFVDRALRSRGGVPDHAHTDQRNDAAEHQGDQAPPVLAQIAPSHLQLTQGSCPSRGLSPLLRAPQLAGILGPALINNRLDSCTRKGRSLGKNRAY